MRAFLSTIRTSWALVVLSLTAGVGCVPFELPGPAKSSVQQLRSGYGEQGNAFVGFDLLVTDDQGQAIACDEGELKVAAEYSIEGPDGPYNPIDAASLEVSCAVSGGDFALVVDNSGSESGFLPQLREAAGNIVDGLLPMGGRASLVRVSTESKVMVELTGSAAELHAGIERMHVGNGWTSLYDGIRMGNETLGGADQPHVSYADASTFCIASQKLGIVAFTDGKENNSSHQKHQTSEYPGDGIDTQLEDLYNLKIDGITTPIYTVGLGNSVDHEELEQLAENNGGRHLAIESADDLPKTFDLIADYADSRYQVCADLPAMGCGDVHMRINYTWTRGDEELTGTREYHMQVPCPARSRGRIATFLLTLSNQGIAPDLAATLAARAVDWVSPVDAPSVLLVRDDNHHNEFGHDADYVANLLADAGYVLTQLEEPEDGLQFEDLLSHDVVWFSNPGYPPDDESTIRALIAFSELEGGVVLQGDDIAWSFGQTFPMTPLTGLEFVDNGVEYCGANINDNKAGYYEVRLAEETHPIIEGVEPTWFLYGDDIDTTVPTDAQVLAWATASNVEGCPPKPAIVANDTPPAYRVALPGAPGDAGDGAEGGSVGDPDAGDAGESGADSTEAPGACAFTQGGWGQRCSGGNVGCLRDAWFEAVFPEGLVVGEHTPLVFDTAAAVQKALPMGGPSQNKGMQSAFGGQLTALTLNLAFSNHGVFGASDRLAEARLTSGPYAGKTASALAQEASQTDPATVSSELIEALASFNEGFHSCDPADFLAE